jgi:KaiC domain protein
MQFVAQGLRNGENCVYFTLEQDKSDIVSTGDDKGWEFSEYIGDSLAVIQMHPIEVASSLRSIRNELPRMISEFGASRVVFDSITLIEMMFQDRAEGRNQIFRFLEELGEAGATTLVTSEADEEDSYSSRYGVVEYLSDAVFVLQYIRTDSSSETRLALEITKIRDTSHSREVKPYELTDEGIVVYSGATIF